MTPGKNSFLLYDDYFQHFKLLPLAEAGILTLAIFEYHKTEKIPKDLPPTVRMAFSFIQTKMDRDAESYRKIVERNKLNGSKGGRPSKAKKPTGLSGEKKEPRKADSDSDSDSGNEHEKKEKKKKGRFRPPTQNEVQEYSRESGHRINAGKFVDFYESKDWFVGKTRMKSWQAAVRNWSRREKEDSRKPWNRDAEKERVIEKQKDAERSGKADEVLERLGIKICPKTV